MSFQTYQQPFEGTEPKIFKTKVSQFNFRAVDIKILEPIDCFPLTKNIFGTQEHDIEFLQVVVHLALVQGLAIAHRLVVASSLGDFLGVFNLHLTPLASATTAQS